MGESRSLTEDQFVQVVKESFDIWCKHMKETSGPVLGKTPPDVMWDLLRRVYAMGQQNGLNTGQKIAQREHEIMLEAYPEIKKMLYKS